MLIRHPEYCVDSAAPTAYGVRAARRRAALVAAVTATGLGFAAASVSAAPTWVPAESHGTAVEDTIENVAPALAADGDSGVLYATGGLSSRVSELRFRPAGGSWGSTLRPTGSAGSVSSTVLGMADDGRAVASWAGSTQGIFFAGRAAGATTVGAATKANTGALTSSAFATSATNAAGDAAVAWVEGTNFSTDRTIVVRVRPAGDADFGPEQRLTRTTDGTVDEYGEPNPGAKPERGPHLAVAPNGDVIVAWSQADSKVHSGTRAYTAVRRAGQATFDAGQRVTDLATTTSANERVRAVAVGADGTVALSLLGASVGGVAQLEVVRKAPNGTAFGAPVAINGEHRPGFATSSSGALIAVDGAGRITAAFDTGGVSAAGSVHVARQATAGGAFAAPVAIDAPAGTYPRGMTLGAAPSGDAVVGWLESTINGVSPSTSRIVVASRRGATGTWSAPQALESRAGASSATAPRVAFSPGGDALVGWGVNEGTSGEPAWRARTAALDTEGPIVTVDDAAPTAGSEQEFSATAVDRFSAVDGELRWDFGDGTTATGSKPTHTYRQAGAFTVRVTASDTNGNSRTSSQTLTVGAPANGGLGVWLGKVTLSTPAPSDVTAIPSLAANGDIGVFYTRGTPDSGANNSSSQAEGTLRPLGGDWSAPQTFGPTSGSAQALSFSLTDDGHGFAAWNGGSSNAGNFGVDREAGALRFGSEQRINDAAVSHFSAPTSARNGAGRTAVAYAGGAIGADRKLTVRVREAGASSFGPEQLLEAPAAHWANGSGLERNPQIVVAPNGAVTVAWSVADATNSGRTRAYVAVQEPGASSFGTPQLVTDAAATETRRENVRDLAVGADGTIAVGYLAEQGAMLVARRAAGASAFDAAVKVNGTRSGGFGAQSSGATLAVDGQGRVTAAFDTGGVSTAGTVFVTQQAAPGGAFGEPVGLAMPDGRYARGVSLAVTADGDAVLAWADGGISSAPRHMRVVAVTRKGVDGAWSAPEVLDARDYGGTMLPPASKPEVAFSGDGDALVAWGMNTGNADDGAAWEARVASLDVAGPLVTTSAVDAVAGTATTLRAAVSDRFSGVASVAWDLGDGTTATGTAVEHRYAAAGRYEATVTATDEHGHATTRTTVVTVTAPEVPVDPNPPVDPQPPVVPNPPVAPNPPLLPTPPGGSVLPPVPTPATPTAAKVSGVTLRGRTVRLRSSKAGKLRVVVQRRTVKRVRKNGRVVKRVGYKQVQRLTVTVKRAGNTSFRVRKLSAGTYRIRVTPTTGKGAKTTSKSVRVAR